MDFSEFSRAMDEVVFATLSDRAELVDAPGATPREVRGMYRAPWIQPDLGTMRTGLVEPSFAVRDADAPGEPGGTLLHGARVYRVVRLEPDGTGITALVLREVQADPPAPEARRGH